MLRLAAVCKRYNDRHVLRDLSLAVNPATVTLVAGPNGAGKSTLLRIMARLAPPDSGTVTVTAAPGATGYLGHETMLYPALTALENLAFWSELHQKPADEATLLRALDRVGLAAFADDAAGVFSRGMAQRLSLARLLLLAPTLVLVDEPLTGLDTPSAASVRRALLGMKENGAAVVWVTHTVEDDLAFADHVLLLRGNGSHALCTRDEYARRAASSEKEAAPC